MADDAIREAVERLARKLILRGYNQTATTIRVLLAAKEAAEAREREAVMQSLAHLGQSQEAYEAQKAAEAEAAALSEKLSIAVGALLEIRDEPCISGDGDSDVAKNALALIEKGQDR